MAILRQDLEALLDQFEPRMRDAFLDAIQDIADNVVISEVTRALEAGDIEGAVRAMNLDPQAFEEMAEVLRETYRAGALDTAQAMPRISDIGGNRMVFRFGVRNPRAEQWLREESSNLITGITTDQVQMVRTRLTDNLFQGMNPRRSALDIVGRTDRAGNRQGGVLGLNSAQERYSAAAREELETLDRNYFTRERRDRRFDSTVRRAIDNEEPLTQEQVARIVGRYNARLLELRGTTIGRTETLRALHAAQLHAVQEAASQAGMPASAVTRRWKTARDRRVRDTHRGLHNDVAQINEPFVSPSGARLMYPGDPSAPPEESIQCRCTVQMEIDFLAGVT